MASWRKSLLLLLMAAVLLLAAGAAAWEVWQGERSRQLTPPLAERLPRTLPGVRIEELPLGPNEFVDATAREKMDYDDVVNRAYTDARGSFQIYIGYWARGKRSPSHIASHTPDRCWTLAGMRCEDARPGYRLRVGDTALLPGQRRTFREPGGSVLHVIFWHRVGEGFYDYGTTLHDELPYAERVQKVIRDLFVWQEDQFFIRVTSAQPLEDFADDPVFRRVMGEVARMGIAPAAATSAR